MQDKKITLGKKFEWAICHFASKDNANYTERVTKNIYLDLFKDDAAIQNKAIAASSLISAKYLNVYHSSELGISGKPEPKSDLVRVDCDGEVWDTISVKLDKNIQILSAEGKTVSKILNLVDFYSYSTDLQKLLNNMPTKLIQTHNIQKVLRRYPTRVKDCFDENGLLLDQYNWDIWQSNNKKIYLDLFDDIITNKPDLYIDFVQECLTGEKYFRYNPFASAEYILTPTKFCKINKNFIIDNLKNITIDLRAKSRGGLSSACIRLDMKNEKI